LSDRCQTNCAEQKGQRRNDHTVSLELHRNNTGIPPGFLETDAC